MRLTKPVRLSANAARAVALLLLTAAVVLAATVEPFLVRAALVAIVLGGAWAALSRMVRRPGFAPAAGYVRRDRRRNWELRTLTDLLLLYIREIHALRGRTSTDKDDPERAAADVRLAAIEREMRELVGRIVRVGARSREPR